ncbi:DUF6185 family protein [Streptomyces sp. NPDC048277]|uniref:DUF6185 family protein n=1 Tax=Streptomyces sp. NPDC048277 TaxID=3155027 RepID=UPI0033D80D95
MRRWFGLLSLVILTAAWWAFAAAAPATARPDTQDNCLTDQLNYSHVTERLQFDQHGQDFVKVSSFMTIYVPMEKWGLAHQLTFGEESGDYHKAMHCLLRGQDNTIRNDEWLYRDPLVTADKNTVKVQYNSFAWIKSYDPILLGPWSITRDHGQTWKISLKPTTLQKIPWDEVTADLDGLSFNDVSKDAVSSDGKTLAWRKEPPERISIEAELPWKRSWILSYDQSEWERVGVATWWLSASVVIALAALRDQRSYAPSPAAAAQDRGSGSGLTDSPARALLQWALLSGAVAVILVLLVSQQQLSAQWRALSCIVAGWVLVLVARPWSRGSSDARPGIGVDPGNAQRRPARTVIGGVTVAAAIGLLVVLAPGLFDLPKDLSPASTMPTALNRVGYALMGLTTLWLWLAAMTAWAWRFASEGGLLPAAWVTTWNRTPVRCFAAVSAVLWVVVGCLYACLWWVSETQWQRVSWLTQPTGPHGHGHYVNSYLTNFAFSYLLWIFDYSWALTGIALFALLYYRVKSQRHRAGRKHETTTMGPDRADFLLIAAVFALTVGLRGARISGLNAQWSAWFALNILSLFLVLAVGRQRSVLSQLGHRFYTHRLSTKKRRRELLAKAHQYRSINRQLRLLDQGRGGISTGAQLEDELHDMRRWLVAGCDRKNPPEQISVLSVALAWGPEGHWWSNAMRAARLAFWFGFPATGALLFLDTSGTLKRTMLTHEPTAIPSIVVNSVAYQLAWAGAGFVLGALWRLLPGNSSPLRAWSLTFAYAVPACLAALLIRFTDTDLGPLLLYSVLMLTSLTLTSIWMDAATFREERQYWPSRFALLQSIYQLRGFSGQIAWLFAQIAVAVTIWANLAKIHIHL